MFNRAPKRVTHSKIHLDVFFVVDKTVKRYKFNIFKV